VILDLNQIDARHVICMSARTLNLINSKNLELEITACEIIARPMSYGGLIAPPPGRYSPLDPLRLELRRTRLR
jgi:hypothetical protein